MTWIASLLGSPMLPTSHYDHTTHTLVCSRDVHLCVHSNVLALELDSDLLLPHCITCSTVSCCHGSVLDSSSKAPFIKADSDADRHDVSGTLLTVGARVVVLAVTRKGRSPSVVMRCTVVSVTTGFSLCPVGGVKVNKPMQAPKSLTA